MKEKGKGHPFFILFYLPSFIIFDEGLECECSSTTRHIKTMTWLIRQAGMRH